MRKMDLQKIEDLKVWTPIAHDLSKRIDEIRGRKRTPYHLTHNSRIVNEIYDFFLHGFGTCSVHEYHHKVVKEMVEPLRGLSVVDNLACINYCQLDSYLYEELAYDQEAKREGYIRGHILCHLCGYEGIIHTNHCGRGERNYRYIDSLFY
jgi:hypothetical protein